MAGHAESRDAAALAAYQDGLLQAREAWRFAQPLTVQIRGFAPNTNVVDVELRSPGRLQGTTWMLDASAIVPARAAR